MFEVRCNKHFSETFMTSQSMEYKIQQYTILPILVWAR